MDEAVWTLCRLVLATVFLMSAVTKLTQPGAFVRNVRQYNMLPDKGATIYGWSLPYVELGIATLLLGGWFTTLASLAAILLLGSFMIAVAKAMSRDQNLECSCFGLLYRERVGWSTQIRDAFLIVIAGAILTSSADGPTITDLIAQPTKVVNSLVLVLTTGALGLATAVSIVSLKATKNTRRSA